MFTFRLGALFALTLCLSNAIAVPLEAEMSLANALLDHRSVDHAAAAALQARQSGACVNGACPSGLCCSPFG